VIHTQLFFGVGIEALFASWALNKPIVGTNHTVLKEFLKYSPVKSKWIDNTLLSYLDWYYEHCDLVTAPSQSVLDGMLENGFKVKPGEVLRVIPNPIDTDSFTPPDSERKQQRKKELGLEGPVVVFVGRFAKEKKIDFLLKAFAEVVKEIPHATLALAGHGAIQGELEKLAVTLGIEKQTKFLGTFSKKQLEGLYQAADLCATASTSEVQSIVMLEAMASGLPIVGVNAPGLKEHINATNGRLAKVDDPESMAENIIELLKDRTLCERLGKGSRASIEAFSAGRVGDQWEALYHEAIKATLVK